MTAGNSATKLDLDRAMGSAAVSLAQALDQCAGINELLGDASRAFTIVNNAGVFTSPKLTALGYTDDEITLIAEAFFALAQLQQVAFGRAAGVAAQNNYFFQAQQLMGITPL